jgi:hypothetical protein
MRLERYHTGGLRPKDGRVCNEMWMWGPKAGGNATHATPSSAVSRPSSAGCHCEIGTPAAGATIVVYPKNIR